MIDVAVKTMNAAGANNMDRIKFLQEAAIMAQFKHPNVVALHGVARENGKVLNFAIKKKRQKIYKFYLDYDHRGIHLQRRSVRLLTHLETQVSKFYYYFSLLCY